MSIATVIMGTSGQGKTTSLRNINPDDAILIQAIKKPLPFRSKNWKPWDGETKTGSIACTDNARNICAAIQRAEQNGKSVVIVDDYQYVMANEFMRRSQEKSFDKFNDIGRAAWDVMTAATSGPDHIRVYILTHVQTDEYGMNGKMKTVGKLLDEKIVLEGMVTTVLRTVKNDEGYFFRTQSDGGDTVKSPMGLFDADLIENDLAAVDAALCEYYGVEEPKNETPPDQQ